jgi:hypothetical protein
MSSSKVRSIPAAAGPSVKIANGQVSACQVKIVCLPVDDLTLARHARSADVAVYMSYDGDVGPAQHQLRAMISDNSRTATRVAVSKKQLRQIARHRRAIAEEKDFIVLSGIGALEFDGQTIWALLVYCAPRDAEYVKVDLPVAWLCPTSQSAVH